MRLSTSLLLLSTVALGACTPGGDASVSDAAPAAASGKSGATLSAAPGQAGAVVQSGKGHDDEAVLVRSVEVFDGAVSVTHFLSESWIVETRADEEGRRLVLAGAPGATVVLEDGYNRVWRLPAGTTPDVLIELLRAWDSTRAFSHVFHRGARADTPYRAFPGGVFVTLDASLGEAGAVHWLQARGLVVERRLPIGGLVLHVRSGPGLAALALATELRLESQVLATSLNLWEPLGLR